MLLRLKISNYALISESEICFEDGLTVITGETGAEQVDSHGRVVDSSRCACRLCGD